MPSGAWFPLVLAAAIMAISVTWHWAYIKRMRYHQQHSRQLGDLLKPVLDYAAEDKRKDDGPAHHPLSQYLVSWGI